ncbi:hypothetical protein ALC57_17073 [Trachymyrmex cornetzi]|uniref:Uncharacterized protein n=1 Tax=Trachymyrmex cornetzi TaxID=471704 RepID=A0A151ITU9_9HYME|nr:hypothetical protein ALC57_17073 [Trachymyrmex cornetzi]
MIPCSNCPVPAENTALARSASGIVEFELDVRITTYNTTTFTRYARPDSPTCIAAPASSTDRGGCPDNASSTRIRSPGFLSWKEPAVLAAAVMEEEECEDGSNWPGIGRKRSREKFLRGSLRGCTMLLRYRRDVAATRTSNRYGAIGCQVFAHVAATCHATIANEPRRKTETRDMIGSMVPEERSRAATRRIEFDKVLLFGDEQSELRESASGTPETTDLT